MSFTTTEFADRRPRRWLWPAVAVAVMLAVVLLIVVLTTGGGGGGESAAVTPPGGSTAAKRLLVGLVAFGFTAVVPGDIKDEYTVITQRMGGQVFRIGPGLDSLNPLDLGPMRDVIAGAVGAHREQLLAQAHSRRLELLESLLVIAGSPALLPTDRLFLARAVDIASAGHTRAGHGDPTIPDVLRVMEQGPAELRQVLVAYEDHAYERESRDFRNTLDLLCKGPIAGMFDRPSSFSIERDTPALSLSLKAIEESGDDVVASAMMCAWAWSAAVIDGHAASGRRRNVIQIQDELWRALRAAPGLVERSDRITRLNRHRGVVSVQSTHSITDLEALPTEADRAKAKGMAARNDIKLLGGMDNAEMNRLHEIARSPPRNGPWSPPGPHPRRGCPANATPAAASTSSNPGDGWVYRSRSPSPRPSWPSTTPTPPGTPSTRPPEAPPRL